MKKRLFFLWLPAVTLSSCKSKDPLPAEIWSLGCVELAPFEGAFRLTGLCCEYVLLPAIKINKERSFKVKGSYHSFTGAGFSNIPVEVSGDLSPNSKVLILRYSVNAQSSLFVLKPGKAEKKRQCFCD